MPRITEELVRKRAEHNHGEITTLEELSLHQQDLEKIEHLDRWCRHLKILYLQNNLISHIENVGRLKELQYLNLALNNIETIENLQGCEFLEKLDFTVNFIGDLLSVESLSCNLHLRELYLTGNPCTEYDGYREFVVGTLPQLSTLDGRQITKSERIAASQKVQSLRDQIVSQQEQHDLKRKREKEAFREKQESAKAGKERKPGFDRRWYTDPQAHAPQDSREPAEKEEEGKEEAEAYTPEYRLKNYMDDLEKKQQESREPENKLQMPKRTRILERNGKMLNVNEGKHNFNLRDEDSHFVLEIECPKYMDTSLIQCDIHTTYVRLEIKSKILQLVFEEELSPDSCSVKRSQTTGHLLLNLPKANPYLRTHSKPGAPTKISQLSKPSIPSKENDDRRTVLKAKQVPQQESSNVSLLLNQSNKNYDISVTPASKPVNTDFTDNPDVPPLI